MVRLLCALLISLFVSSNTACRIWQPDHHETPAAVSESAKPARKFVQADVRNLKVDSRHSESANVGDIAGLLVTMQNESSLKVPSVQIRLSSTYLAGLEVRRTEPAASAISVDGADAIYVFPGPEPGTKESYVVTLTPLQVGEYPGEIAISVVNEDKRELPVAIYEVKTSVGPDRFAP